MAFGGSCWCLFCNVGDLGVPFGHPWGPLWHHLGTLGLHLGTLGVHFATLGRHLGTLGVHFRVFVALWGGALDPFGHFLEKGSKKVPQMMERGTRNGGMFYDISIFSGKW